MNETSDTSEPQPEPFYGRSAGEDLELWQHHASFGGEDKNRMVSIATWFLGASAAMLWYIWTSLICPNPLGIKEPLITLGVATLGMGVSALAGYISLLYGGYSNQNWEKADQIATSRGWKDLLPLDHEAQGHGLNAIAKRLARPCKPQVELAPVFVVFLVLAAFSLAAHLTILSLSIAVLCT
ncbi:MAG: hypothetical protein ACFFCW_42205 [Candidatus Hodarchaeota archaeon]